MADQETSEGLRPGQGGERSARRSEAHRTQTYRTFLHELAERGKLQPEQAEEAAVAVLCALDQRLTPDEGAQLEAQLPARLREMLWRCERHEGKRPRKLHREAFLALIAEELRLDQAAEAEPIVRLVFQLLREKISEGEAADVQAQLPLDLKDLWAHPA